MPAKKNKEFQKVIVHLSVWMLLFCFSTLRYVNVCDLNGFFLNSDTDNYLRYYGDVLLVKSFSIDYFYFAFSYFLSLFFSFEAFLALVVFIFYGGLLKFFTSCNELNGWVIIFLLLAFFYPPYNSLSELVIRQGLGFSVLFFLDFFVAGSKLKTKFLAIALACMFHFGFIFLLIVFVVNIFIRRFSFVCVIWSTVALMYIFNVPVKLIDFIASADVAGGVFEIYANVEYVTGFKLSFFLISIAPLLFFMSLKFRVFLKANISACNMYRLYLIANSCGFLFSGFAYYDRVMIFSWVLIPFLSTYFLKSILNELWLY